MADELVLELSLKAKECVRGESVFFRLSLKNVSTRPEEELRTLDAANEATFLSALPAGTKRETAPESLEPQEGMVRGCGLSRDHRDGIHWHAPDQPYRIALAPGQTLETTGDVLEWLGELEEGEWDIYGEHQGLTEMVVSRPVRLRVAAVRPMALVPNRPGPLQGGGLNTSASIHSTGKDGLVFYQQYSTALPKNARLGVRVGRVKQAADALAAQLPLPDLTRGHMLWMFNGQLALAMIDVEARAAFPAVPVKGVAAVTLLHAPLTMPDQTVFVPVSDGKGGRVDLLHVEPTGASRSFRIDLGRSSPMKAYSCCWEGAEKLHFAWIGPSGRDVSIATVFLDDPDAGTFVRPAYLADDPLCWVDLFLDYEFLAGRQPVFQDEDEADDTVLLDPEPPQQTLWCASWRGEELACIRALAVAGSSEFRVMANFDFTDVEEPEILHSVVTPEQHLALLLADKQGELYLCSTSERIMRPVAQITDEKITRANMPGLVSAGEDGPLPWVYLRYVDSDHGRIGHILLEPSDEEDPEYDNCH